MSFLSKLFGGTFESNRDEAEAHFASGRWGEAKIAYGRALDKAKGHAAADEGMMRERISTCKAKLAKVRLNDAEAYAEAGELDEALAVLEDVLEISDAPELMATVKAQRIRLQALLHQRQVGGVEEMSEDDVLAVIAGTWTEAQAEEMAGAPDQVRQALLLGHDGNAKEAAELLRGVLTADGQAALCYLHLELGKQLLAGGEVAEAATSLESFLTRCDDGEAEDLKLRATTHLIAARVQARLGNEEQALSHLRHATQLLPGSHEVAMFVGVFQRERGDYAASLASLEKAQALMGLMKPDVSVIRELGLTYLAKGDRKEAKETLASVVEHFASKGEHEEIDPLTALALARLHEEDDELGLAADLLRHLAAGHDTANHFHYNCEAARLLRRSGAKADILSPYLEKAALLAKTDEHRAALAALQHP